MTLDTPLPQIFLNHENGLAKVRLLKNLEGLEPCTVMQRHRSLFIFIFLGLLFDVFPKILGALKIFFGWWRGTLPNISRNLHKAYVKLHCKGESYRYTG